MSSQRTGMAVIGRRAVSAGQIQALTGANDVLRAENTRLETANADLTAANRLLEQKLKSLQVAVTISLAIIGGLSVGLATSMAGATAQIALSSAAGVFFGVIMASMAILAFMRR